MYKIGLSTHHKRISEELFFHYAKAGIEAMELSVARDEVDSLDFYEMARLADKYAIELWSFHLPFNRLDISSLEKGKGAVEYHAELIRRAADCGIDTFVVHSSGERIEDGERHARMERAKESLNTLAEVAARCGATVAVENLPRRCLGRDSDEMLELLSANSRLRSCFDTNHLLYEDAVHYIHAVGDKIITTHVSDYDFVDEKHWFPGEGKNDWQAILAALGDVGYRGPWMYEVAFADPNAEARGRELTCEDFFRNAKEILEGRSVTVLS